MKRKKENAHQIKYFDHIKIIHVLQKSFLLLTVSHTKDEAEFVVTNDLFLSNLSIEYWRFKVVHMKVYQLPHCLEKRYILPRKKKNYIVLMFFKCNNKRFVLYESHGFTFSSTYIIIQSCFSDIDVSI